MRTLFLTTLVLAAVAATDGRQAQAEADPRPPLWEFLTVERYTQALVQVGALALRDQVEFTYSRVSMDMHAGTVTLHGLKIYPETPWPATEPCVVDAERATIRGASLASWDTLRVRVALQGAMASLGCVMPPVNQQVKAAGMDRITLDQYDMEIAYTVGPGRLSVAADALLEGLAAINLNLNFDYFAVKQNDDIDAYLSHASLTVENLGLWEKAKQFLPPEFSNPDNVAAMVQGGLAEALKTPTRPNQPARPLTQAQQAFVNAAVRETRRFLAEPGSITVEAHPPEKVYLNADIIEDMPTLFEQLQPTVSSRPTPKHPVIAAARLQAAITAPDQLSEGERREIGMALLSGKGVPRAVAAGRALLEPMAAAGDGEAGLALATVLKDEDPADAYRMALYAGAKETAGAVDALDMLERHLTTPEVLTIQAEDLPSPAAETYKSVQGMRSLAMAHMTGFGARRSYRQALYWATLANAAGDRAAGRLIADIEDRMRYRGDAAAKAWQAAADGVAEDALKAWMDHGMADRHASDLR